MRQPIPLLLIAITIILTIQGGVCVRKTVRRLDDFIVRNQYRKDQRLSVPCFQPPKNSEEKDLESLYDFKLKTLDNQTLELATLHGKVILLVNVATYSSSSNQYPQLNQLKDMFKEDLEIIAVPCNQFGHEEPGEGTDILNGVKHVRPGNDFTPNFIMTMKMEVNGLNEDPLFSYLKRACPSTRYEFAPEDKLFYTGRNVRDIRWNFEKFLIHPKTGRPVRRYDQRMQPIKIANDIETLKNRSRKENKTSSTSDTAQS